MAVDIGGMRAPYKSNIRVFTEDELISLEPIGQFASWFNLACKTTAILEPNAMCLATSSKEGIPSCRMVLLKRYGKDGFIFFTNYNSRKGKELAENPNVGLCFFWEQLKRSIRIEGYAVKVSEEESNQYFQSRPKDSQISACASPQSQVIASRDVLEENQSKLEERFKNNNAIIKPEHWGGYRVIPHKVEFWQGQTNRLHDRIVFRKKLEGEIIDHNITKEGDDEWLIERLAP